jgi:POT family proton-dependent oligopeptide transporter
MSRDGGRGMEDDDDDDDDDRMRDDSDDRAPLLRSSESAAVPASRRGEEDVSTRSSSSNARVNASTSASTSAKARLERALGGHPIGLVVLGATEMWERFGYYAARALLALYVTKILTDATFDVGRVWGLRTLGRWLVGYDFAKAFPDATTDPDGARARVNAAEALSAKTYGAFACLTYLTPVFGGILSDAALGPHRSALVGATVMAVGYGAMASERAFLLGMLAVCLGNGAFKPSMSTQLSALYGKSDPKRDAGFSIFYCCINVGAFFSPLIAGTVRLYFGYGAAFGSAALGMACALGIYTSNRKYVLESTVRSGRARGDADEEIGSDGNDRESEPAETTTSLSTMIRLARENSSAVTAVAIVCAAGVGFSMVYEQQGSTLMIFSDEHINLHGLPTEFVAALNPFLVLALTPAVTALWDWQAKSGNEPHQMTKIAIGCGLLSASFAVLMFGALPIDSHASPDRVSVVWIVLNQVFLTAGELFNYPVALSYISKVAPERLLSALIGLWFGSSFFGNYFSGLLGATYPTFSTPSAFFATLAVISGFVCVVIALARAPLRRHCPVD